MDFFHGKRDFFNGKWVRNNCFAKLTLISDLSHIIKFWRDEYKLKNFLIRYLSF